MDEVEPGSDPIPGILLRKVTIAVDLPEGNTLLREAYRGNLTLGIYAAGDRYYFLITDGPEQADLSFPPHEPDGQAVFGDFTGALDRLTATRRYLDEFRE
ncbi:MAG: hypothetical protein HY369_01070 [Candidatus Aenigmarchaeota archaeon]|nr:hypothetical protein [Candidatus Aenigmarchaeota archaeon]